ncbi:MAG: Holliday junction branch migration DNA helicase RuvB [Candidatus Magasanikbacteria bacterium CG_4_10_14_0_8_um_filter_32_14]|uniref:Holliday junction branch migration complex subunit RuvB n=2 Tax=Candidatus Magasanikiibacteriota TaxID=1752731 RepID=A0A2M7R9G5_9BACT|nr:MAG: Holliday junction DNA helicase RuvB [Candidatus Magasanikbacteria bacterium CG1_02_32_51]PIY93294.1 MAG: Holliday junction branch migration DNA helicase RuvB [Candidatus Magasanikbacteria bacterium CG_4_10_14_0_8_um_filter_32_14]
MNPHIKDSEERLVKPTENSDLEEQSIEVTLRPQNLTDFVGQNHIKEPLIISIEAAKKRKEPIEHVLLYGNPGLGKTTLANIIAKEMGVNIKITAGPALERIGDLAAILSNLAEGDILFIDEIHRLNKSVEEVLYSAMEDYALDIIIGKGPTARTLRMPLEKFTLIGATTKLNLLSSPLRDRFGHVYHLNFYEDTDIEKIINRNANILEVKIRDDADKIIAVRSRKTPRVANRLLKRVRDYAQVKHNGIIDGNIAKEALDMLNVDKYGLDEVDRKILKFIIENFAGGPVGLNTLAAAIAEEMDTVENIYEPFLLQIGMLERTPRGRKATTKAYEHLGKKFPKQNRIL